MTDSYEFQPEDLTPGELQRLIASNARTIEALTASSEETRQQVDRAVALAELAIVAVERTGANLDRFIETQDRYWGYQGNTNHSHSDGVDELRARLQAIEQRLGIQPPGPGPDQPQN